MPKEALCSNPDQKQSRTVPGTERRENPGWSGMGWKGLRSERPPGNGEGELGTLRARVQRSPAPGALPPSPRARGWGAPGCCGANLLAQTGAAPGSGA